MSDQDQIAAVHTTYSAMLGQLINMLVHRGVLTPTDGKTIVQSGKDLLSRAPVQGDLTDTALAGLDGLLQSISPHVRDLKRT